MKAIAFKTIRHAIRIARVIDHAGPELQKLGGAFLTLVAATAKQMFRKN